VPAETYRQWAVSQDWSQQARKRPIPAWLRDNPMSTWNCAHGCGPKWPEAPYTTILQDTQRAAQKFGPAMLQLTGWERYGAWVEGDYFPPAEGWAAFDAMVASLRPQKLWLLPSALFLDTNTDLYRAGTMKASTMLDRSGQERTIASAGVNGGKWVYMDVSTEPWRQAMIDAYATLAAHGVDLIQFDSSMVMGNQDCFNPQHSQPAGQGRQLADERVDRLREGGRRRGLGAEPQRRARRRGTGGDLPALLNSALGGAGENQYENENEYAPYAERVPMYQYVYHDVIPFLEFQGVSFGDGSFFRLAAARNLVRGESPAYQVQRSPNPTTAGADEFMKAALQARTTYAKKFLFDGVMLPAPLIDSPATTVQWILWQQNNMQMSADYPSIAASAWRAADDTVGIVMTNIARSSVSFSLPISFARLGLAPGAAYTVQSADGSSISTLDPNLTKDAAYPIFLKSQQILLVLVTLTRKPAGSPASIAAVPGDGQRAPVNASFAVSLRVVVKDAQGAPVVGVTVTFAAPSSGASGSLTGAGATATAVTDSFGVATAPAFTANEISGGPYTVTASVTRVGAGTIFSLTNNDPPVLVDAVVNAQSGSATIAPNTWVEIDGANFTPTGKARTWQGADSNGNRLPTMLDGVSVTVDGKPAFVYYISPKQINVLTPPDALSGLVEVKVTRGESAASLLVLAQATSPSFFVINGGPHVLGTHSDGTLLGPASLFPGVTRPARRLSYTATDSAPPIHP
jgi:hypothetical protein